LLISSLAPPPPDSTASLLSNGQVRPLIDRVRESGGDLAVDDAVAPHPAPGCARAAAGGRCDLTERLGLAGCLLNGDCAVLVREGLAVR